MMINCPHCYNPEKPGYSHHSYQEHRKYQGNQNLIMVMIKPIILLQCIKNINILVIILYHIVLFMIIKIILVLLIVFVLYCITVMYKISN